MTPPVVERAFGRIVGWNNDAIHAVDRDLPNPLPLDGVGWHGRLVANLGTIRAEWDRAADRGLRLPLIEELIAEHQGNTGEWRAGLLVSRGRPRAPLADEFPATIRVLAGVPGLRSALWSVLVPGAELHEHQGPNAGVLRYHLGVVCPEGCALRVGETVVPYREGEGVLFDDTAPHAAWNRGDAPRVTLFLEVLRPLPRVLALRNRGVQELLSMDARYRAAPGRAAARHRALNPGG